MSLPTNLIRRTSRVWVFLLIALSLVIAVVLSQKYILTRTAQAISPNIVISQVYGGGGNAGSTYRQDFIELFNRGSSPQSLNGWSVQYASSTGTSWQKTDLTNVTLQPGQYYLVRQAQGAGGTTDLPTADVTGSPAIAMSATAGKVVLLNTTTLIASGTSCPSSSVVDIVGFGTGTNCFEGSGPTPPPSNTNAVLRASNGCTDTDQNATDFSAGLPTPRNTASTFSPCGPPIPNLTISDVSQAETNAGTTIFTFQVNLSAPAGPGGVTFDIATADGTAQDDNPLAEDNDYVGQSLTGQTIAAGNSSFAFNVTVNGDAVVEPTETFFANVTNVTGANVTDGQGQGTITNDDSPNLSINDVTQNEGTGGGTTSFTFTVSLSTSTHGGVTYNICSADGTAQDGSNVGEDTDYAPICFGGQSIPNGSSSAQHTVNVNADSVVEPNETFFVNVDTVVGASVTDGQGQGTITNDDVNVTPIHDIQGNGASSPLVGQTVTTTGIVTLLRTSSNAGGGTASGFFLQDANADADPNTSEGIFVFTSSVPTVAVGDEIYVTGTIAEFNGLTEISPVTSVVLIDTGNTLPTAVTLDSTILDPTATPTQPQLEKYEGMRLTGTLKTVAPNNNFYEVETVLSSVARPMREPGIPVSDPVPPDPTSGLPDPNIPIWDENPERLSVDTNGRAGSPNNPYTSNVTFTSVSGPLDYSFGRYRLIPDANPSASANMTAVAVPTPLASEFTIASYNIENFNNNTTQKQKAALTIRDVLHLPDIIGTVEIFDLADLQALAAQIQTISGVTYSAHLVEQDGTSEDSDQDVGFLVKTSRVSVTSVTQEREEETYAEPGGGDPAAILHDRPPLVLDAIVDPSGSNPRRVLVVVNHLRSFIDIELVTGDGPRVREKRKKQAESLADLLNDLQTANPGVPVISVGDYNEYEFNSGYDDSMSVIKGSPTSDDQIVVDQSPDLVDPNLTNLTEALPAAERYSFMFDGTPQGLDHHVVNTSALARNTRIAIARVNSDFPEDPAATYASNAATPERNSDHDPVVSYYSLNQQQVAGSVIISEFRFRGPGSAALPEAATISFKGRQAPELIGLLATHDEFVEIYNNTNSDITVSTTDGSSGWALVAADGVTRFIIPNATVIPARGHFLGVNTVGYSLSNYGGPLQAAGNTVMTTDGGPLVSGYTTDIPDGNGIALFRSADPANFTMAERLDAAGYTGVPDLYREGAGFPTGGSETTGTPEYSFLRTMTRATGGLPKDTGNNTADFLGVGTLSSMTGFGLTLGAPGPENLTSPLNRTAQFGFTLLDPTVSGTSPPNRVRDMTAEPLATFGTMIIRRTVTNNTGQPISRLRFRIVEITTLPFGGGGRADLRALNSTDEVVNAPSRGMVQVFGTTVQEPPFQVTGVFAAGGGWNTSLDVPSIASPPAIPVASVSFKSRSTGTITLGSPLNNGASADVQFKLGVMQTGNFFFFVVIEPTLAAP